MAYDEPAPAAQPRPRRSRSYQTLQVASTAAGEGSASFAIAIALLILGYSLFYAGLATLRGKRVNFFEVLGLKAVALPKGT